MHSWAALPLGLRHLLWGVAFWSLCQASNGGQYAERWNVPDTYFSGISTFAHLDHIKCLTNTSSEFDIAVLGLPIDTAVSFKPGARFGPRAIRFGSARQTPFRTFNPILGINPYLSQSTIVDCGDVPLTAYDNAVAFAQIEDAYSLLLEHSTPSGPNSVEALTRPRTAKEGGIAALDGRRHPRIASLGGDHSIVLPILRSLHKVYGPVTVIHFDAHLDSWKPSAYGASAWDSVQSGYTHGTMFHHAAQEGLTANNSVHLGLRGLLSGTEYDDYHHDADCGFSYLETQEMVDLGPGEVTKLVKERVGDSPVYLSIDVDVMDPSVAPATGTPVAGGLLSRELRELIRRFKGLNLVGVDVVEVSPPYDTQAEITALAAAELMYELISIMVLHPIDRVELQGHSRPTRRWASAERWTASRDVARDTEAGHVDKHQRVVGHSPDDL